MKDRIDLVRGWLRKAQDDLKAGEVSLKASLTGIACFHAQQAAEKFPKAYLTHRQVEFPFTHNLARLVRLCVEADPGFAELTPVVEPLTPYAVELRYDTEFSASEEDARQAQMLAEKVRAFVQDRLPAEIKGDLEK